MAEQTTSAAKGADEEERIPRDRLVAESEAFTGHPSHVMAGALHTERKQTFTVTEAKKLIDKWLKTEVDTDTPEEES